MRVLPRTARLRYRARLGLQALAHPPYVPAGHYYSPQTSAADVARAKAARHEPEGIDLGIDTQVALARRLDLAVPPSDRWTARDNQMFGAADAAVLRAMLLEFRPRHVVEVGSGFSTAVMLDVADRTLPDLRVTCVEPYSARLRSRLRPSDWDRLTLLERPVQEVAPSELVADLGSGDVLFIDSTHVAKAGSDVLHLFQRVLPRVPVGGLVHVHDIFWPFEYPDDWLDRGRDWNELYLLHAFLQHNVEWEILLFASWLWQRHPELVPAGTQDLSPGSIWLRRRSP